jgi:predicted nucleotidyltransferase
VVSAVSTVAAAGVPWGSMGVSGDARIEFTALSTI